MPENKHLRRFVVLVYVLFALLAIWVVFRYALGLLAPFIIAFLLACLIEKPVIFFSNRLKVPRPAASAFFTLGAFSGVGILLYFLIVTLLHEIQGFFASLPEPEIMLNQASKFIQNFLSFLPDGIVNWLLSSLENLFSGEFTISGDIISSVGSVTASAALSLPTVLLTIIIILASTYFFSADFSNIRKGFAKILPQKWSCLYCSLKNRCLNTLARYLRALVILMIITFAELTIGFYILGFDYALVIAFFASLVDALPIFGVGTILIPWAIYNLIIGDIFSAIALVVLYAVVTIVRNILEPKIVGSQIGLHPIITLFSVYIGLRLFGIWGIFTPLFVVFGKELYLCIKTESPKHV